MVEGGVSSGEGNGDGVEGGLLFGGEDGLYRLHVSCQTSDGEQGPGVAFGNVLQAAVFLGGFVESYPAGEVVHGLGAGPVGIVLVPCHHAAVVGGFAEELVVPEAYGSAKELRGGDGEGGVPEDVVEAGGDAPCAERVEEHGAGIGGFVGVVFVEQPVAGVGWVGKLGELCAEGIALGVGKYRHARNVSLFVEVGDLFGGKGVLIFGGGVWWGIEEAADGGVMLGEVHGAAPVIVGIHATRSGGMLASGRVCEDCA